MNGTTMLLSQKIQKGHNNKLYPEDTPIHEWYRFVLSYPPHLVRDYIQHFELGRDSSVLDPFCGTGTTIVEAQKMGLTGFGLEAAPMAYFASSVKVDWSPDPEKFRHDCAKIARIANECLESLLTPEVDERVMDTAQALSRTKKLKTIPEDAFKLLLTNSISALPLHKSLVLLEVIESEGDPSFRNHQLLALAKALVSSISNLHFGPEVGVSAPKFDAPVIGPWLENANRIANDLSELRSTDWHQASIMKADAREFGGLLNPQSIDLVITSPPYPNEKDYTRTTRLESVLLGFFKNKADLQGLKRTLIRSNTRTIYKGDIDEASISHIASIQAVANQIEARRLELGKTSGFERLYAKVTRHYFGGMARHFIQLKPVLRQGAHLVYVVGDQASFFQVMIRTGQLLAEVAESVGYKVKEIQLFRSRLSTATKQYLREEAVVLEWQGDRTVVSMNGYSKIMKEPKSPSEEPKPNRYSQIIDEIFRVAYVPKATEVLFQRTDIEKVAKKLDVNLPKNLGDLIYSFRYRVPLPDAIREKAPSGKHWIIRPKGRARYAFTLVTEQDLTPSKRLSVTKIPDATPGIVTMYALSDEQALLAKLRYNRLIDIFSGVTCYSIQNHLRTFVAGVGQIETDELYIGIDKKGSHYVFPVQAKGGKDKLSVVQIEQDFALCASKFPNLICRPIAAQFISDHLIALFELEISLEDGVRISSEKHYELVRPSEVTPELLQSYKERLAN